MYIGIKHLHSFTAYFSLIALLATVIYVTYAFFGKKQFTKTSKLINLVTLISCHLQLIIGLIVYSVSPLGISNLSGETMKQSVGRLYALEHPLMMIVAITLITIGYSKAKRQANDRLKFKSTLIFFSIGLFLILLRIPWNAWLG